MMVKEALACGLPVVSVDVGDVAERIDGIEGSHLAQSDPTDLAAKLDAVRRRAQRLDCATRLHELSILSVAQRLKQCYEGISRVGGAQRRFASTDSGSPPALRPADPVTASVRP